MTSPSHDAKPPRPAKGAAPGLKLLLSSAALAATLGGWAVLSAADGSSAQSSAPAAVDLRAPRALALGGRTVRADGVAQSQPFQPSARSGTLSSGTSGSGPAVQSAATLRRVAPPAPLARTRSSR